MLKKMKLWAAQLLRKLANRFERRAWSQKEIRDYFEKAFFSGYFPEVYFPDGPPPSLKTISSNLCRQRILKGIGGPIAIVKKDKKSSSDMIEIWVEDTDLDKEDNSSSCLPKRKGWGDLGNTTENLIKRGVIKSGENGDQENIGADIPVSTAS